MNYKKSVALLVMIFLVSFAPASALDMQQELDGEEVPSKIRKLIGKQKVNLYIDGEFVIAIDAQGDTIQTSSEEYTDPSLEVDIPQETLDEIENSEDGTSAVLDSYNDDKIKITKHGFFNKIRFAIAGILAKIAGFFS